MTVGQAWQETLRSEYAAGYGYGIVGGRLGPADDAATAAIADHRSRRDYCIDQLTALGIEPEPGAAAYEPPTAVRTEQEARDLAAAIEQGASATYLGLVGQADAAARRTGVRWLQQSSLLQAHWTGKIPALPGMAG